MGDLVLRELSAKAYAEIVLPLTAPVWSDGRSFEDYARHTAEIAQCTYGRRSFRTMALCDRTNTVLASFKRYERAARLGNVSMRSLGIGAVFTPAELRGRGYASAMLAMALDQARQTGIDFAYLFSDIRPQFYTELGFHELPSRAISLRADTLPAVRMETQTITARDWTGVRACFEAMEAQRSFALTRTPAVWDWIRRRIMQSGEHSSGQPVQIFVRRGASVAAYVIGQREPRLDAFVLDEMAYIDDRAREILAGLLRNAAGDLRRITGWLPPAPARMVLPRGSVRKRMSAIFMVAPITPAGRRFLQQSLESTGADAMWSLDHI